MIVDDGIVAFYALGANRATHPIKWAILFATLFHGRPWSFAAFWFTHWGQCILLMPHIKIIIGLKRPRLCYHVKQDAGIAYIHWFWHQAARLRWRERWKQKGGACDACPPIVASSRVPSASPRSSSFRPSSQRVHLNASIHDPDGVFTTPSDVIEEHFQDIIDPYIYLQDWPETCVSSIKSALTEHK